MAVLSASIRNQLRDVFRGLPRTVTLMVFGQSNDEGHDNCVQTRALVEELVAASPGKVQMETVAVDLQPEIAALFQVERVPAIAVLGGDSGRIDFGIRFYGAPAGYEFATLVEDIRMVSAGTTDLGPATIDALSHLASPLHLQVFVTPTCPYCPRAVLLAHKLAVASQWIRADAVDATEFPELADRYHVYGVPRTVINETVHIEGAVPEAMLLAQLVPLLESTTSPAA